MQTTIELPPPVEMTMPFSQVLGRRRSRREFSDQSLDLPLLSTLLWACAGQNGADGRRTAPSALDSREVECFVFDQKGVWSYCAETNALKLLAEGDHRSATTAGQGLRAFGSRHADLCGQSGKNRTHLWRSCRRHLSVGRCWRHGSKRASGVFGHGPCRRTARLV